MAYELRDPNVPTIDEMRAWQGRHSFDVDDYMRKFKEYQSGEDESVTAFMPPHTDEKTCKCVKEYIPSASAAVHYACTENRMGQCKWGAYQHCGGECFFLAKMSLPGMMGHIVHSCVNVDAQMEANRNAVPYEMTSV